MAALTGLSGATGLSAVAGQSVAMIPWTPLMEPTLRLFLDYRAASTLTTSDGNVTQWRDRSPKGYVYNSTGTVPLGADGINFSSAGSMSATARLGLGAASQFTIVSLLKNMGTPPAIGNTFFQIGNNVAGSYLLRAVGGDGGVGAFRLGGNKTFQASPAGDLITSWYQPDNATFEDVFLRQNGIEQAKVGGGGTTVNTDVSQFSRIGSAPWNFTLPAALVFASNDATLRERAEGWIAHEFGGTALLDSSHPFKNIPPMVPAPVVAAVSDAFVTAWKTDHPGTSTSTQIDLPLRAGYTYDFVVDWGDGTSDTITSPTAPEKLHTYATAGTYTVSITGVFPCIFFNNGGDRQKLLSVDSWGTGAWLAMDSAFFGCSNVVSYAEGGDFSAIANFAQAWQNNTSVTSYPQWDLSSGTNFFFAWSGNTSVTSYPQWDLSSGTNFSYTWQNNSSVTSYPLWDLSSGTNFDRAWRNNTSVTSYPLWDLSSGTNFVAAWLGNTSVTSYPLWDLSSGTNFSFAWQSNTSVTQFAPTGIKTTFSLAGMQLDAVALDTVYTNLATASAQTITVTGNPGVSGDNPSIATAKGWTVVDA